MLFFPYESNKVPTIEFKCADEGNAYELLDDPENDPEKSLQAFCNDFPVLHLLGEPKLIKATMYVFMYYVYSTNYILYVITNNFLKQITHVYKDMQLYMKEFLFCMTCLCILITL